MSSVVVTGGAGFVGSHLCERLVGDGSTVVSIDNLITGSADNLRPLEAHPRFEAVLADVSEPFDIPGPVDAIYHLACPASPMDYARLPLETLQVSVLGTRHVLDLARRKGARVVLASTSEVYGDPERHPQQEDYWGNVNCVGPRAVYDEGKRVAETWVSAYRRLEAGVDGRIVRIFNTYGPRMRLNDGRVVPAFIHQALSGVEMTIFGKGDQTRSLCYVDDLVEGLVRMLGDDVGGDPINLGNPEEITVRELAEIIRDHCGSSSSPAFRPLPVDDPRRRRPDITRARERLGWAPTIDLATGLAQTIAWARLHWMADPSPAAPTGR
ncbi:MAG: SDR family oxidoreductase [Actinobacteria bacterium]|nr:SDR family oxidoreductase [Actinomycetota bacterium]